MKNTHKYLSKCYFDTIVRNIRDFCDRVALNNIDKDSDDPMEIDFQIIDEMSQISSNTVFLRKCLDELENEYLSSKRVTYRKWFELCHKYIDVANKENMLIASDELQTLWHNGRDYYDERISKLYLSNCKCFVKKIKRRDRNSSFMVALNRIVDNYNKIYNSNIELSNDMLVYRNINAVLDKTHRTAYILDKYNHLVVFDIIWDWWYLIDSYLDNN